MRYRRNYIRLNTLRIGHHTDITQPDQLFARWESQFSWQDCGSVHFSWPLEQHNINQKTSLWNWQNRTKDWTISGFWERCMKQKKHCVRTSSVVVLLNWCCGSCASAAPLNIQGEPRGGQRISTELCSKCPFLWSKARVSPIYYAMRMIQMYHADVVWTLTFLLFIADVFLHQPSQFSCPLSSPCLADS